MSKTKHPEHHTEPVHKHDDDLVIVPKGRSKWVFFLTLGLMLFVLLIFTVGPQLFQTFAGPEQSSASKYLTWRTPSGTRKELSYADFILEKRKLSDLLQTLGQRGQVSDEQTGYWVVLDEVARDSGVAITDQELTEWIVRSFGSVDVYRQVLAAFDESPKRFEATLRRQLRVERYRMMIMASASQFDPEVVESRWKAQHQEYRFEYTELAVADVDAEARAEVPSDEDLELWFQGLDEYRREAYRLPAAVTAQVAVFLLDGSSDANLLLGAYPGEEVLDIVAHAQEYYQGFSYVRFKDPDPDFSQGFRPELMYLPYEEVEEQCLAEAPIYDALTAWHASMAKRFGGGEEVDLEAEAAALGLATEVFSDTLTTDEWAALERPWAGRYIGQTLTSSNPGFLPAPVVETEAFLVARVTGKVAERDPQFAEIRDEVAEQWISERASALALERLEALRDEFGERPEEGDLTPFRPQATAERFDEVCKAQGYALSERAWQERSPAVDPDDEPTPADEYFRSNANLYALRVDSIAPPGFDRSKSTVFLTRIAGVRDPENSTIEVKDFVALRQAQQQEAAQGFEQRTFISRAFMQEQYDVWLEAWAEESPQ